MRSKANKIQWKYQHMGFPYKPYKWRRRFHKSMPLDIRTGFSNWMAIFELERINYKWFSLLFWLHISVRTELGTVWRMVHRPNRTQNSSIGLWLEEEESLQELIISMRSGNTFRTHVQYQHSIYDTRPCALHLVILDFDNIFLFNMFCLDRVLHFTHVFEQISRISLSFANSSALHIRLPWNLLGIQMLLWTNKMNLCTPESSELRKIKMPTMKWKTVW